MKKGINFGVLMVFLLVLFSGCWAPKTIMTTANVTQPVMVGKVTKIGGAVMDTVHSESVSYFPLSLVNSQYVYSSGYYYGSQFITQEPNIIDEQLLVYIDNDPNSSTSMIQAKQIRFKVSGGYWLFAFYSANKGWIDCAKYNNIK